jgi:hypothetical protein
MVERSVVKKVSFSMPERGVVKNSMSCSMARRGHGQKVSFSIAGTPLHVKKK